MKTWIYEENWLQHRFWFLIYISNKSKNSFLWEKFRLDSYGLAYIIDSALLLVH